MEKIEGGEYVRTKEGEIHKVIKIMEDDGDWDYYCCENNAGYFAMDIAKHSKIISEVVEVGDYVNGREVKHIAMFEGFPDYPKLIFVDEKHLIPDDTCENEDIKTILTKEQYEANCYKVREESYGRKYD